VQELASTIVPDKLFQQHLLDHSVGRPSLLVTSD
jgi:hypothetical protein